MKDCHSEYILDILLYHLPLQCQIPIGDQQTTNEGCLCCETGPITLEVNVNKRGFVVGESMWVSGCLDNQSNSDVSVISCTLTQVCLLFHRLYLF